MKKVTTTILQADGVEKQISVWIDEETLQLLEECGDAKIMQAYLIEEYRTSLIERKETRRHQSLEASMDKGFDIAEENDVAEQAIKKYESEELHKALEQLEPQQKWLIEQTYFEGRTRIEIAHELGISKAAINNRLNKIYKKLKIFLK